MIANMTMHAPWHVWLIGALFIGGCATSTPPSRLDRYLSSAPVDAAEELPIERPLVAALMVIADASTEGAPPPLPEEAQHRVAEQLKEDVNRGFPIAIQKVLHSPADSPRSSAVTEEAKRQGLDFLLLMVLSAEEREYPISLFLGWTRHRQPGFRRDNWSLAEAALINVHTGAVVLRAEGRSMATLDSPTTPGINQWYPVIYLRPQDPERRLWPPTYEGAPITLRVVAMTEAVKRLGINLRRAWIEQRESERAWW